jgi:hypothetical protein
MLQEVHSYLRFALHVVLDTAGVLFFPCLNFDNNFLFPEDWQLESTPQTARKLAGTLRRVRSAM